MDLPRPHVRVALRRRISRGHISSELQNICLEACALLGMEQQTLGGHVAYLRPAGDALKLLSDILKAILNFPKLIKLRTGKT